MKHIRTIIIVLVFTAVGLSLTRCKKDEPGITITLSDKSLDTIQFLFKESGNVIMVKEALVI